MVPSTYAPRNTDHDHAAVVALQGDSCRCSVSKAALAEVCPTLEDQIQPTVQANQFSMSIPRADSTILAMIRYFIERKTYPEQDESDKGIPNDELIILCNIHLEVYLAAVKISIPLLRDLALPRFLSRLTQILHSNKRHRVVARIVGKVSERTHVNDEINECVLINAVANFETVRKNAILVKVLEEKYGWIWTLALEANTRVKWAASEPQDPLCSRSAPPTKDIIPNQNVVDHEVELCEAREPEVEAIRRMEEATKVAAELRKQLEDARKRIVGLNQNRDIAGAAAKLIQEENSKLKAELIEAKSKLEELQMQAVTKESHAMESLEKENTLLKAMVKDQQESARNRRTCMLQKQIEAMQSQHAVELRTIESRTNDESQRLREDIKQLVAVRDKQTEQIEQLEKHLKTLWASHASAVKGLEGRIGALHEEVRTAQAAKVKEVASCRSGINQLSTANKELPSMLDCELAVSQKHEGSMNSLETQLDDVYAYLRVSNKQIGDLRNQVGTIRREKETADCDREAAHVEMGNLRRELQRTRHEFGQVRHAVQGLRSVRHFI